MSTGSELLRRLRQQQDDARRNNKQEKTAAARKAAGDGGLAAAEKGTQKRLVNNTVISACTIEVCLGPDCSVSGGGAALLEIEELVSRCSRESKSPNKKQVGKKRDISVVPGGCRDFCTMGPNVHVKNTACGNDSLYSKVNDPEACRTIVDSIFGKEDTGATLLSDGTSSTLTLLRKREDGIRWRSHREKAANERRLRVRER